MLEAIDVLEALLFASDTPVEVDRIQEVLDLESPAAARELVEAFQQRLQGRALQVVEAGGGFRLVTRPELAPWLVKLQRSKTRSRLSRPALETLAIVAYHQPVSRPQVDAIRGVNSEGVLDSLLDRRMVKIAGRKDSPGRPFLYETTREFLVAFGLRDLGDLPKVEGQLQMPVTEEAGVEPAASGDPIEQVDEPVADEATTDASDEEAARGEVEAADGAPAAIGGAPSAVIEGATGDAPSAVIEAAIDDAPSAVIEETIAEAPGDAIDAPAAFEGTGVLGENAAPIEAPTEPGEGSTGANPPQQDPGPGGADVTPRS